MNIGNISTIIWSSDTTDHLTSRFMIRDKNGNYNLAKITTVTGHVMVAGVEEDEDGTYITYSVYASRDKAMDDEPITTDGFKATSEEHAATYLADVLASY